MKDSERICAVHKERVIKLEEESTREIDSRAAERQAHLRALREVKESLDNSMHSNSLLNEKVKVLEQDNLELLSDLKQLKKQESSLLGQVEALEVSLATESKALEKFKTAMRELESEVSSVKADQAREKMEYEEKLLKIKSTSGQRKQSLLESEMRLNEVTRLWHADQTTKDELAHNLRTVESKYEDVNIEIQKLRESVSTNTDCLYII